MIGRLAYRLASAALGLCMALGAIVACTDDDAAPTDVAASPTGGPVPTIDASTAPALESVPTTSAVRGTPPPSATTRAPTADTTSPPPPPTTAPTSVTPPTTVTPPTSVTPPTDGTAPPAADVDSVTLGLSVEGRPIRAVRRGARGGTAVLVVGVIHGNEPAGESIVDALRSVRVPRGVELWLVPSMNPDGQAAGTRQNANGVDLNRNFPTNWGPVAQPGDWQYAGVGPASEPEIQAMLRLAERVRPSLTLWYHQDLFRINPAAGRDGEIRRRYAELTGLPIIEVSGGTYTGTASQWSRTISAASGVGFTVELGETLDPAGARQHAEAVVTVAADL